jgi:hypothetical protein
VNQSQGGPYPDDLTLLDPWDRKLRSGELRPGPVVNRIEGGDVPAFLAWPKTRYFSEPAMCTVPNDAGCEPVPRKRDGG